MLWINSMKFYTCIFLVFVALVAITQATCISKSAKEFENNCYELFTIKVSWYKAKEYCSNFYGLRSLAKVSSPSVLDFLNSLRPNDTVYNLDGHVWLGARYQIPEGEWLWTDGTKANLTSMWGKGEPNYMGKNKVCLQISYTHLNDEECQRHYSFICIEAHEQMNSFGLAKWIGIGIGICVVVTFFVLAIGLVMKFRCK